MDSNSLALQPLIPDLILPLSKGMVAAIDLNCNSKFTTIKIEDVSAYRKLSVYAKSKLILLYSLPKQNLWKAHVVAQKPCLLLPFLTCHLMDFYFL